MVKAKKALQKDACKIKKEFKVETESLIAAKSASLSLEAIIAKYQQRLSADKKAKLKLTDRVSVKKQLIDKFIKEIEGFRTRPSQYKELLKVDKHSIQKMGHEIKRRLHYK